MIWFLGDIYTYFTHIVYCACFSEFMTTYEVNITNLYFVNKHISQYVIGKLEDLLVAYLLILSKFCFSHSHLILEKRQ